MAASPTPNGPTGPTATTGPTGRTPAVVVCLVAATFTVILNETIMINAIPRLADDFHVSLNAAQWLSTAFMLTMASVIPVTGWFLQRVTTRAAFTVAMTTFMVGTALALVAPWFWLLLVARVVQAGGTAVMMPLLMTTLMTVVAPQDRGRVMGNVTLAMSVAPALGPAVSGVLLQLGSWRLIFATVLPIAAVVTWLALRRLQDVGRPQVTDLDRPSVVLAPLGFGALVYGLSEFATGARLVPTLFVLTGLAVVAAFAVRQLRLAAAGRTPLLDLRVLRHRTYTLALVVMSLAFLAMLGVMILLPLYLQDVRGLSALQTGLMMMPGGLAMGLLGPRVGAVFDRLGGRRLVVPGALAIVVALVGFARIGEQTPYALLLAMHVVLMVGLATLFTPVFTLGLGSVPPALYSHASSTLGTLQQVAGAFGTALMVTVSTAYARGQVAAGVAPVAAYVRGLDRAYGVAALVALVVAGLALLLPNRPDADPADAPVGDSLGDTVVDAVDLPTGEPVVAVAVEPS